MPFGARKRGVRGKRLSLSIAAAMKGERCADTPTTVSSAPAYGFGRGGGRNCTDVQQQVHFGRRPTSAPAQERVGVVVLGFQRFRL